MNDIKLKLVLSVAYPLILFFIIIFLSNSFVFLLGSSILFLLSLSFILFNYESIPGKINGILRVFISVFLLVVSGYAFKELDFLDELSLISSVKLGWLLALGVILLINFQYLFGNRVFGRNWQFIGNDESSTTSSLLIKRWIGLIAIVLVLMSIITIALEIPFGVLSFMFSVAVLFISAKVLAKHHLGTYKIDMSFGVRSKQFWSGALLSGLSLILLFWPSLDLLSLGLLLFGIHLVQKVTSTQESFSLYSKSVTYPGILLLVLLYFVPKSTFMDFDIYLNSGKDLVKARNILKEKRLIEDQIGELYYSMKLNNTLSPYIDPDFEVRIINQKPIWLEPELNLELVYSYELIDPRYRDSVSYFPSGSYQLGENSVVYAIAKSFEISLKKYLFKYFQVDQKVTIDIIGSADAAAIEGRIPYNHEFDNFLENKGAVNFSCNNSDYIFNPQEDFFYENCVLAFLRALSLRKFIAKRIKEIESKADVDYTYKGLHDEVNIGGEYRKVEIVLTLYDVLKSEK